MKRKLFDILERKKDCVLLKRDVFDGDIHRIQYQVRDIENDIIYMGYVYDSAKAMFDMYDINRVREERKKIFEDWLNEFAEA